MNILKNISPDMSKEKLMHLALLTPKTNQIKHNKVSEIYKKLFSLINNSLEDIVNFRKKEGSSLQKRDI